MERHLDDELQKLKSNLLRMAALTEEAIHRSIESLAKLDENMAEQCIRDDRRIDDLENEIEEATIELLALFQPMAKDLRFITTGMRINTELERIADLTVNICQRVKELTGASHELVKPLVDIPRLANVAKWMVKNTIDAYVHGDQRLAEQVIYKDKEANSLRTTIITELVVEHMMRDGTSAPRAVPLLLVARDLERICDQAKYISEDVIYMVKAKVVKHHPERLRKPAGEEPAQS